MRLRESLAVEVSVGYCFDNLGYVFEAYDHNKKRKVALKRIQKVGNKLSREYEILLDIKESDYVVKILVFSYISSPGLLLF